MTRFRRGNSGGGASGTVDKRVGASVDDGNWVPTVFRVVEDSMFIGRNPSNDPAHTWARWTGVAIAQGATIDVAYINPQTVSWANDGVGVKTNIYFNDIDTAIAPTTIAEADALALTTAFTAWDDQDFASQRTQSPSIIEVVKEVIDRGGWSSGNDIMLVWKDDGSTSANKTYDIRQYDFDIAQACDLHIEWST